MVVCLAGDGCMQEGVGMESVEFAGHQQLGNLILIYDSNDVTLDAMANKTQSEKHRGALQRPSSGVQTVDGHDMAAFLKAFNKAKKAKRRKAAAHHRPAPSSARASPRCRGHREGARRGWGEILPTAARIGLGLPADQHFYVSEEVYALFCGSQGPSGPRLQPLAQDLQGLARGEPGQKPRSSTRGRAPDRRAPARENPGVSADAKHPGTRGSGREVLQPLAAELPLLISGSADLHGSTYNYINADKDFEPDQPRGAQYSLRHPRACHGRDVQRRRLRRAVPPLVRDLPRCLPITRVRRCASAALAKLPVGLHLTHDSVGVGEDGPTHQPVETVSALRMIPNFRRHPPGGCRGKPAARSPPRSSARTGPRCSRSRVRPCPCSTRSRRTSAAAAC